MTGRLNRSNTDYSKSSPEDTNLIDTIISTKCFEVLKVLLYKPGSQMFQKEIVKGSNLSPNTAVPVLNKLTQFGILKENTIAGVKFYSIVEENPVLKQLKILINISDLYELTRDLSDDVELYLFGSAARGEDTENSDIDLLIIASGDKKQLTDIKDTIRERLSNKMKKEVNPIIFTPIEYANLFNKEKAFYESIEKDKIRVL